MSGPLDDLLAEHGIAAGDDEPSSIDDLLGSVGVHSRELAPGPNVAEVQVRVDSRGRPAHVDRGVSHQYMFEPQQITAGQGEAEDYAPNPAPAPAPKPVKEDLPRHSPGMFDTDERARERIAFGDRMARRWREWIGDVDPSQGDVPTTGHVVTGSQAALQGLRNAIPDKVPGGSDPISAEMRTRHAENVAAAQEAQAQHPFAYGGGQALGAALTMGAPGASRGVPGLLPAAGAGTVMSRIGQAAAGGGLLGASSAQQLGQDPATGGLVGAATGVAGQGLVEGVNAAAPRLANYFARSAAEHRAGAAGVRGVAQMRDVQSMPGGIEAFGNDVRNLGISRGLMSPDASAERAVAVATRAGQEMDAVAQAMDDAERAAIGSTGARQAPSMTGRVDVRPVTNRLRRIIDDASQVPGGEAQAEAAQQLLATYEPHEQRGLTFSQAHRARRYLDQEINWSRRAPGTRLSAIEADMAGARADLSASMESAIERVDPALLERWQGANRAYQVTRPVLRGHGIQELRDTANRAIHVSDYGAAIAGASGPNGSPQRGLIAGAANIVLRDRERAIAATGAETLAGLMRIIQTTPQAFGPHAPALAQAASRGSQSLAAMHWVLMQRDPAYRANFDTMTGDEQP